MHEILPFQDEGTCTPPEAITVRPGTDADVADLARLAALDDRDPGVGPHLVAEQDGEIVAAVSTADGIVVADPFRLTLTAVDLLRAHATRLGCGQTRRRGARRRVGAMLAAFVAGLVVVTAPLAASPTALVAGMPVKISPATKGFAISVRCAASDADCEGVLDVRTAGKIKPYGSSPAAVAQVGTFPFRIAAGTSAAVTGRVYGPALAQAMLRGRVALTLTPRAVGGDLGPARTVVFTYRAAR